MSATPSDNPTASAPRDEPQPGWPAQRFARLVELAAEPDAIKEGAELQRLGRAAIAAVGVGVVEAHVRERSSRPRRVLLKAPTLPDAAWEAFVEAATQRPAPLARLLAGELPADVEDLVTGAAGERLFPSDQDLKPECRCEDQRKWCRHAVAVGLAFAASLRDHPFGVFSLRGLPAGEVIERLRLRRAAASRVTGPTPAYTQRPAPAEHADRPLELCLEDFWTAGRALNDIDTTARRPEIHCPLLRRLGPSPFERAKFPLLGLLATCYESISEAAVRAQERADQGLEQGLDAQPAPNDPAPAGVD